jgi:pyruvate-formate lyase
MNKYSKKAQDKIEEVMHEFKRGQLKSDKGGKEGVVKSRDQAITIGRSKSQQDGLKVPKERKKNDCRIIILQAWKLR